MDIREYIINNFKDSSNEDIKNSIEASIKEKDELTLPGLGVFMELIWKNSNETEQKQLIEKIKQGL